MLQLQIRYSLRTTCHQILTYLFQILIRAVAFQHGLPCRTVTDFLGQQYFQQPREIPRLHPCNGFGLRSALINPAGRQLGFTRDTDFHVGGIGQIHNMGHLTVIFSPVGLATGSLCQMTLLRADNTAIARRQFAKARKAVALIKTFLGESVAGNTLNPAREFKAQRLPELVVQAERPLLGKHGVADRFRQLGLHLSQATLPVSHNSTPSTLAAGDHHSCPPLWLPCR